MTLEAETAYERYLHGEAVAFGMVAASDLAVRAGLLARSDFDRIVRVIRLYKALLPADGVSAVNLLGRIAKDKKTIQGKVHFVLPTKIGEVKVLSGLDPAMILQSIEAALESTTV